MNEETILYRLDNIDKQLAELVDLSKQTALQDVRIAQNEKDIRALKEDVAAQKAKITNLERHGGDVALKWLGVVAAGAITILLGFIAVKVGLNGN